MQAGTLKKISDEKICHYYQAHVVREQAWFFVAIVRSCEHMMFDRTLDTATSTFEFFVPSDMVKNFLDVMSVLEHYGVVNKLVESENRLINPEEKIS